MIIYFVTFQSDILYCATTCVKGGECGAFYFDQNGCHHSQFNGGIVKATSGTPKAIYVKKVTTGKYSPQIGLFPLERAPKYNI